MTSYYNEFDRKAAAWLRELIAEGHIPTGYVDERSITDVRADELAGFVQLHFFAGIGGWPLAARLAGWPDDREIVTGSCPCQPFSVAGKGAGTADARHLWPDFFRIIRARRPACVMGEQVAAAVGKDWLLGVRTDMEGIGYAGRGIVVPACAVNAPHRRDRLWFAYGSSVVGDMHDQGPQGHAGHELNGQGRAHAPGPVAAAGGGDRGASLGALVNADSARLQHGGEMHALRGVDGEGQSVDRAAGGAGALGDVGDAGSRGLRDDGRAQPAGATSQVPGEVREQRLRADVGAVGCGDGARSLIPHADGARSLPAALTGVHRGQEVPGPRHEQPVGHSSPWDGAKWLICHDGKARRVEPSIPLLVDGIPNRVGLLRGFGNAIAPQIAAEMMGAWLEEFPA